MCDMQRIMAIAERHGLAVVEDAAQALGASLQGRGAGAWGLTGCFSFYPFKTLGGLGDGGAVTTNDPEVARMATLLRFNGEDRETGEFHLHGYTALLDNVNAAVLDVKLRHLPAWIEHRRAVAARYTRALAGTPGLRLPAADGDGCRSTFQNYVVCADHRDALRAHLRDAGVETLVHWARPIWDHAGLQLANPGLPVTERLCREVISLPMSAETTFEDVDIVAEAVASFAPALARA
jgi:dTDP-4-amino-4,6-dideoxygalactose transaminase